MSNKYSSDGNLSITDEVKEQNTKYNLSKFDYDLYNEEDDLAEKVIRIKRVSLPNKGERWKFIETSEDNKSKLVFTLEGAKLNNKEKEFLRTVDGVNFLIEQAKNGIYSCNSIKKEIKKRLK